MSIIKIIQESDIIKSRTLFPLKAMENEIDKMNEIIKEKDVIINNNNEKICELEAHIKDLRKSLQTVVEKYEFERRKVAKEKINLDIVYKYEKFINQITADYEVVKEERNNASQHLACIEEGFADLLNKYERLKTVVIGYQENQEVLIDNFNQQKEIIELMQKKYDDLKLYTTNKLDDANKHLARVHKRHVNEMAKIKTHALQSKVKINELEKTIATLKASAAVAAIGTAEEEENGNENNSPVKESSEPNNKTE